MVTTRNSLRNQNNGAMTDAKTNDQQNKQTADKLPNAVYIIFVSLVLDLLAFTVILPLFPSLLEYYGNTDTGGLYHTLLTRVQWFRDLVGAPDSPRWNSVLFGGLIGSLFSFLQYVTSPLFGAASDVYGRRPVLIVSLVGIAASYVIWAVSHNFTVFVIARFIGGLSKGNVSLCTAIATDVTTPKNRSRAMAMIGIAFSIGFLVGPLIGAIFASYARRSGLSFYTPPALFALIMAVADLLFVVYFFSETLPQNKRAACLSGKIPHIEKLINPVSLFNFSAVQLKNTADSTSLQRIGLSYFLYLFSFSGIEFTLTFLLHFRFNYNSMQQGLMFCYTGIIMVITQGGFVRRLKAGREKQTAEMAMLILLPSFTILAFSHNLILTYFALMLYSLAAGSVVPCLTSLVSTYGQADQKGAVLGIFRSLGALARALAPICACTLYWSYGVEVCYMMGAIGLTIPMYLLHTLPLKKIQ